MNLKHGIVKSSLKQYESRFFHCDCGRRNCKGKDVCSCVHVYILIITTDTCMNFFWPYRMNRFLNN